MYIELYCKLVVFATFLVQAVLSSHYVTRHVNSTSLAAMFFCVCDECVCMCFVSMYACNYIFCVQFMCLETILHFCINVLVSKSSLYSNFNHEVPFARACISTTSHLGRTMCMLISHVADSNNT